MATINQIIYNIKNISKGGLSSDDNPISDRLIKHWISVERSALLKAFLDKEKASIQSAEQSLGCVYLVCVDRSECDSIGIYSKEYISRTENKIPIPLDTEKMGQMITRVSTIYGEPIEFTSETISVYSKYKKYGSKLRRAFIRNEYLYIENSKELELVKIDGIFQDPQLVNNFMNCDGTVCYSDDDNYPIPESMISNLVEIVIKKYLNISLTTQQDKTNDANN